MDVSTAAAEVEYLIKEQETAGLETAVKTLATELERVSSIPSQALQTAAKTRQSGDRDLANKRDHKALLADLQQLRTYLEDNDSEAVDHLERIRTAVASVYGENCVSSLEKQINSFDFDQALEILNSMRQSA